MAPHSTPSDSEDRTASPGNVEDRPTTTAAGQSFVVDVSHPIEQNLAYRPAQADVTKEESESEKPNPIEVVAKRKARKKRSKNKAARPTGFENNYADAPITPADWEEEKNVIYHPSRSFADRMESCIQRYRAKRRFDSERKDIFDKYLSLGGIDTSPKQFTGGLDQKDLKDLDADQIATMTATDTLSRDLSNLGMDDSIWAVDFEAVAKCFFSSRVPIAFDLDVPGRSTQCTSIVRNFLNYILYHDVCPEYKDQVFAARAICDKAEAELLAVKDAAGLMPGDFNMACSTLYGGYYQGLYSGDQAWARDLDIEVGMDDARALKVIKAAVGVYGTDEQANRLRDGQVARVPKEEENVGFEITEIIPMDEDGRDIYKTMLGGAVKPLGRIRARGWARPFPPEEDMTDDEDEHARANNGSGNFKSYEFWIEEDVLEHCFVGMKIEATVWQLNIGISYFDAVLGVYCSFHTNLENEMMSGWREPVAIGGKEEESVQQREEEASIEEE